MTYALDSNIISFMLKGNTTVRTRFCKAMDAGGSCIIPPVVYYEVKRGLLAVNATAKARDFEQLSEDFGIGEMDIKKWDKAAHLYAEYRKHNVGDADTFIAAYCIDEGFTLVTNNVKHFKHIDGLKIEDWSEE